MRSPDDFNPFAPDTLEEPFEFYEALRREAPVYEVPGAGWWAVSRYDDVVAATLAPETFSSKLVAMLYAERDAAPRLVAVGEGPEPMDVLAIADDPAHARQRKVSNLTFSVRRVNTLEPAVRSLTHELLDECAQHCAREGAMDWMAQLAVEMPTRLICRLLGLPLADCERLRHWADDGTALLSGVNGFEDFARLARSVGELSRYLAARWEEARREPRDDVLGDLARARSENPDALSDDEVVSILLQLLSAGSESTTALLGSAAWLLTRDMALQRRLRDAPALIPAFVEETLRLESPFQGHFRVTRCDAELAGTKLPRGARLMLLWASANRDERRFERPGELDLERPNAKAHLGFGIGMHHCLGASLARLEARVALTALLERCRELRLATDAPRHVPSIFLRRLVALPVEGDWL